MAGKPEVDLTRVPHRMEMPLGHEVLVTDSAGVQDGGAADQLAHLFGDVVLEDLVHERVAALHELAQRRLVGVIRAFHVGQVTLGT